MRLDFLMDPYSHSGESCFAVARRIGWRSASRRLIEKWAGVNNMKVTKGFLGILYEIACPRSYWKRIDDIFRRSPS
jgi:hypothetical protein